jgi:clorobiocin/coumermycin A biosynthesis protein CloN6/CouN6
VLPSHFCQYILKAISDTQGLLREMEAALRQDGRLPADLRDAVRSYNRKILAYSSDQIIPVRRPFGGRWFDDATVPREMIEDCLASVPGQASIGAGDPGRHLARANPA